MNNELDNLEREVEREYRLIAPRLPACEPPAGLSAKVARVLRAAGARWHAARLRRWQGLGSAAAAAVALLFVLRVGTTPRVAEVAQNPGAALEAWADALAMSSEQVATRIRFDASVFDPDYGGDHDLDAGELLDTLDESFDAIDTLVGA